jgi:hypothetical protein
MRILILHRNGERSIGKTTMLHRAVAGIERRGGRVLNAAPANPEDRWRRR